MGPRQSKNKENGDGRDDVGNIKDPTPEQLRQLRLKRFEQMEREAAMKEAEEEHKNEAIDRPQATPVGLQTRGTSSPVQNIAQNDDDDADGDHEDDAPRVTPQRVPVPVPVMQPSETVAKLIQEPELPPQPSQEDRVHLALCELIGVSIDQKSKAALPYIPYVPEIAEQLVDQGEKEGIITTKNVDSALYQLLSFEYQHVFVTQDKKMSYLVQIYNKLFMKMSEVPSSLPISQQEMADIEKVFVNYICSMMQSPSAFNLNDACFTPENPLDVSNQTNCLIDRFYETLQEMPLECWTALFKTLVTNCGPEDLEGIMNNLFKRLVKACYNATIQTTSGVEGSLTLLTLLLGYPQINELFLKHPVFFSAAQYTNVQVLLRTNLFCAALNISTMPEESNVTHEYFDSLQQLRTAPATTNMLRDKLSRVVTNVMQILKELARHHWPQVYELLQHILILHKDREKSMMFLDPIARQNLFRTDGFFINFCTCLARLCEPFLTANPAISKLQRFNIMLTVNCKFLQGANQITQPPEGLHKADSAKGSDSHFMTELYFVTIHAFHQAFNIYKVYLDFLRRISEMQKRGGDVQQPEFRREVGRKLSMDVQLFDKTLVNLHMKLCEFTCQYVLYLNNLHEPAEILFSDSPHALNLKKELPITPEYALLPLYAAEDITEYMLIYRQSNPEVLKNNRHSLEIILSTYLIWISKRAWLGNPHARAQMFIFLSSLLPHDDHPASAKDDFPELFNPMEGAPFLVQNIVGALLNLFVQIERTGSNNQFYEKFGYRHQMITLFMYLTAPRFKHSAVYVDYFLRFVNEHPDTFVQLSSLLLNDMIYELDDCLSRLKKMKEFEIAVAMPPNSVPPPWPNPEERLTAMQNNQENLRIIKPIVQFLTSNYNFLHRLTELAQKPFLSHEIRDKIVTNLNYAIAEFNGPHAMQYKVSNLKELGLDARSFMNTVIGVYTHFVDYDDFLEAIVEDTRSFDLELFKNIALKLESKEVVESESLDKFRQLFDLLEKKLVEKEERDEAMRGLGEIPEEFLDPITSDLMKDPVQLPTSRNIVDRLTITKHLLSDDTDPFNRQKLTKEMLVPQPELKQKIQQYLIERLGAKYKPKE